MTSPGHGSGLLRLHRGGALAALALCAACGSGGGGGGGDLVGEEVEKPGGGTFFVDPNRGGGTTRLHLAEMFWARIVDVHDVESLGRTDPVPVFRDFAINENIQSDGNNYRLETNPITQKTRLVILRERGAPDVGNLGTFNKLLHDASVGLPPIQARNDDGSSGDQYSYVARNAGIVLRFDDVLDDDLEAQIDLPETVRMLAGYPPETPFPSRQLFDPNHGALVGGEFHSTRVLIDLTVSETERASMVVPQPVNAVGLPPSLTTTTNPSAAVRIPTKVDPGSGQFKLLRGLSGVPLASFENGPMDRSSPTLDIVRAMRAGNPIDPNNGYMLDLNAPEVVGGWDVRVDSALADPQGEVGFSYLLDISFQTVCRMAPGPGDVITLGEVFFEVLEQNGPPDVDGEVQDMRVRSLADQPLGPGVALVGNAIFLTTYQAADPVSRGCWLTFTPQAENFPVTGVLPESTVLMRFSEPMDPRSVSQFDNFYIVFGDSNTVVNPTNLAVGQIRPSTDLKEFTFEPSLPLRHGVGASESYHIRVAGPTDLAGNDLVETLPPINFTMSPNAPAVQNGSRVLRFNEIDELEPVGLSDLRGQFFYDFDQGLIRPRPVAYTAYPADRTVPVPGVMTPFTTGVQTPLSPLGSKLHALWRYCDVGWQVLDETKYNLDVFGLAWAPVSGTVLNDFYETFEIRLAHSRRLPDEAIDQQNLLPSYANSGLVGAGEDFTLNILEDPLSPQKTVHPRTLGYQIKGVDMFVSSSGRNMMPYPLNRGSSTPLTYTWRDTAVLAKAGGGGTGIPLDIEVGAPLFIENDKEYVARNGQVPSFGLPLLIEYRCFPTDQGLGLNALDISLAVNSSPLPSFRSYSTGGYNRDGIAVRKNPDEQPRPTGGFNPSSTPVPGAPTQRADDNSFYIGQLEVVTRVSRVHTVWIDTNIATPNFIEPIVLPTKGELPSGTDVIIEYRGAHDFVIEDIKPDVDERNTYPFDSQQLNAYGDIFVKLPNPRTSPPGLPDWHYELGVAEFTGAVQFVNGVATWSDKIDAIDGGQYVQLRFTFLSNIETLLGPELSAIGIAYTTD